MERPGAHVNAAAAAAWLMEVSVHSANQRGTERWRLFRKDGRDLLTTTKGETAAAVQTMAHIKVLGMVVMTTAVPCTCTRWSLTSTRGTMVT